MNILICFLFLWFENCCCFYTSSYVHKHYGDLKQALVFIIFKFLDLKLKHFFMKISLPSTTFFLKKTILLISVFFITTLSGQVVERSEQFLKTVSDKVSIGVHFGPMVHYGDIKAEKFWPIRDELRWGGAMSFNYVYNDYLSFSIQALSGSLAGIKSRDRGGNPVYYKFNTELFDASGFLEVNLNRLIFEGLPMNEWLRIYGKAGIGVVSFRSQLRDSRDDSLLDSYGWSEQDTVKSQTLKKAVIPIGIGGELKISKHFYVLLDVGMKNVLSNKLDAFIPSNPDNERNDIYGFTSLGVSYRIIK